MKKIKLSFLILIIILIIVPILFFNYSKNQYSYIDNKMLKELDELSPSNIDEFVNDRIGLRKESILIFNKINKVLFNYSSNPKYIYSDDGKEVFNKIELDETNDNYYQAFSNAILRINDFLKTKNIPFYYVVTPSKASVYSNFLPDYLTYSESKIIDFQNNLKEKGVDCVDLFTVLKEESKKNRVFNRQYDVFHWNDYGLFIGSNALLKEINKQFPNVQENDIADFEIKKVKGKDLIKKEYLIDEDVELFSLKNSYQDCSDDYRGSLNLYEDFQEFYYLKTNNEDKPKILMFGGSYFISENRYEYICNQSSDFIIIHNYNNIFNIKKYVEMFKPDLVILDTCEYTFKEYYFSEYYMKNMDLQ